MANPIENRDAGLAFIQLWSDSLSLVMGQIAAVPFPFSISDTAENQPAAEDVFLTVTAAGGVRGELSLRIPQTGALALVKTFLGEAGEDGRPLGNEDRAALEELFRQIAGHVVTAAHPAFSDLSLTVTLAEAPTWSPAVTGWIMSDSGAPRVVAIQWQLSAALNAALLATISERRSAPFSRSFDDIGAQDKRLGMFLGLELDVTLRLGGRDILLKDVLELGPGSVLELDREIHDAADLLLDGKLVARGEVVMVNGNYGMRVTEVFANPQATA